MKTAVAIVLSLIWLLPSLVLANDPGKERIGMIRVDLIFATNGDLADAGEAAKELDGESIVEIQKFPEMKFAHYRLIGGDRQPIWRSYENWLAPLKPSQEILLSFEPRQWVDQERLQLDVEYWQSKQKLLKTDPVMRKDKPLYLLGPSWRSGRLLFKLTVLELDPK